MRLAPRRRGRRSALLADPVAGPPPRPSEDALLVEGVLLEVGAGRFELLLEGAHWDPEKHPRWPKGTPKAGKFIQVGDKFVLGGKTYEVSHVGPGSVHADVRSEEHTTEIQSPCNLVCRLLLAR